MVPLVAGLAVWTLLLMSTADTIIFRNALGNPRFTDIVRAKGASSVLLVVNHGIGQGAYGVWLARKTGAGAAVTVGLIGYVMASDLTALFSVAAVSSWLLDIDTATLVDIELIRWAAPVCAVTLVSAIFIGPRVLPRFIPSAKILTPWLSVGSVPYFLSLGLRSMSLFSVMVMTWLGAHIFGLALPLGASLAYLPIIFLAATLPINVFGFGAVQLVWVAAFDAWATGEEILAFQLAFQVLGVSAFLLRGLPFLPSVLREIDEGKMKAHKNNGGRRSS